VVIRTGSSLNSLLSFEKICLLQREKNKSNAQRKIYRENKKGLKIMHCPVPSGLKSSRLYPVDLRELTDDSGVMPRDTSDLSVFFRKNISGLRLWSSVSVFTDLKI